MCSDGFCWLSYIPSTNEIDGDCDDQNSTTRLHLKSFIRTENDIYETDADTQSQINLAEVNLAIQYWCRTNNCNNRTIAELIIKAVKDHYDLSPMYEALNVKIKEDFEEEHTTTS
jgi:hypothetical protein